MKISKTIKGPKSTFPSYTNTGNVRAPKGLSKGASVKVPKTITGNFGNSRRGSLSRNFVK
jgi:hypothetical protein